MSGTLLVRSGGQTRTADLAIMSRALLPTELRRRVKLRITPDAAHQVRRTAGAVGQRLANLRAATGSELPVAEPSLGIEPRTSSLPWRRSTTELRGQVRGG